LACTEHLLTCDILSQQTDISQKILNGADTSSLDTKLPDSRAKFNKPLGEFGKAITSEFSATGPFLVEAPEFISDSVTFLFLAPTSAMNCGASSQRNLGFCNMAKSFLSIFQHNKVGVYFLNHCLQCFTVDRIEVLFVFRFRFAVVQISTHPFLTAI
jgi:hypothetical protein